MLDIVDAVGNMGLFSVVGFCVVGKERLVVMN